MTKHQIICSCLKCRRETTTGQLTRSHTVGICPSVIPAIPVRRVAWNKGKTASTDVRVQLKSLGQLGKSHTVSAATKARLSIVAKARGFGGYQPLAGRTKKFKVFDSYGNSTTLQSTYEYACFEILCELGVNWIRPKALKYDGKNYFADFYLVDFEVWLDPKNDYKAKCDAEKIRKVKEQNNVKLYVLTKEQLTKQFIGAVIQR